MENFPDSVIPFLIIAAVVVFRVVSAIKGGRRNRRVNKSAPAKAAPPKAARGFVPWEDEFRDGASPGPVGRSAGNGGPAQTAPAGGGDETFSAWSLSVDDDPPAPVFRPPETPPSPAPPKAPEPGPAGLSRFPEAQDRFAAVSAGLSRFAETPGPGPLAAPARSAPAAGAKRRGLSALQRGVVWAEILGAPKGLRG
jgi:hypothetical protein